VRKLAIVVAASAVSFVSCQDATAVRMRVLTDVTFKSGLGIAVSGSSEGAPSLDEPLAEIREPWAPGEIGDLVLLPSGGKDAPVRLLVVMGITKDPRACRVEAPDGCIFARRRLSFVEHRTLTVPMNLYASCIGVPCGADSTCNALGQCVAAEVDPAECVSPEGCALPLGASSSPPSPSPTAPSTILTAGGDHTCAVIDGVAWCWGGNASGELGDGTTQSRSTPTRVTGLPSAPVTAISAGHDHTCAVVAGDVWCWGAGGSGELGVAGTSTSPSPRKVPGLPAGQATAVNAGRGFTCASAGRGAYCWGSNSVGRLGDGTGVASRVTPAPVVTASGPLTDVTQLAGQGDKACARNADGAGYCWGHNESGALGDPSVGDSSNVAVKVLGVSGKVVRISTAGYHTCALLDTGAVQCFGQGTAGELGDGRGVSSNTPVTVTGIASDATWVAAVGGPTDGDASCAVQKGRVKCWGEGQYGRLGDQGTTSRRSPVEVPLQEPAVSVEGGYAHFCALVASGAIHCWGRGTAGQLGDGATANRPVPVVVTIPPR